MKNQQKNENRIGPQSYRLAEKVKWQGHLYL